MVKRKVPGVLWVLPIVFGFPGGAVAALIASLKYEASWWELLVAGFLCSIIFCLLYFTLFRVMIANIIIGI